jgi:hypothetical protein
MTTTAQGTVVRGVWKSPIVLWLAFVIVHLWLGILNLYADGYPLGDVTSVYKFWSEQGIDGGFWVGIDGSWVYPIVAIVPMLIAHAFGPALYASTWLSLMMLADAIAFGFLIGWGRHGRNTVAAWWWLGFLVLLGPIALGRVDSFTVPIAMIGVLFIATRPALASVLLTVAAWIKIWPGAIVVALVIATKARWRVLVAAAGVSVGIIAVAVALGSGMNVFSFVTQQTGRGLQIEAPISSIWLWQALAGRPGSSLYYDRDILTFQVLGDGVGLVSSLMTPLLVLVVLAIMLLAILGVRNRAPVTDVLPPLVLALITAFIAFNKVGSPQFISWLAVPVILGLVTAATGHGRSFRTPAILVAVLAALTQSFYPYLYGWLLALDPVMLVLLTARNLLLFVLLGWAVASLWRSIRPDARHEDLVDESGWLPAVWPLAASPVVDTEDPRIDAQSVRDN